MACWSQSLHLHLLSMTYGDRTDHLIGRPGAVKRYEFVLRHRNPKNGTSNRRKFWIGKSDQKSGLRIYRGNEIGLGSFS